ncbi:HNH endonuclease [Altererythrobacter sp. GH1-8]|uniref:HNH endonuclease n=1 Tax=Altererythrobacter sp. GH1-8 TaxID=3349333 RepID=UPI00374D2369
MKSDNQSAEECCWLCGRPFGNRQQWHHLVPKAKKGRDTVALHPICHRAIHKNFTNADLARFGKDHSRLMENEKLATFVAWVQGKPPDFHAPTR